MIIIREGTGGFNKQPVKKHITGGAEMIRRRNDAAQGID